jgi:hypothetical protein
MFHRYVNEYLHIVSTQHDLQLGSDFAHRYAGLTGRPLNQATETHCKRELMHKVWETLLDDDFIEAYDRGLVCRCHDGTSRRFFPRIVTYSADYPEKYVRSNCIYAALTPYPQGSAVQHPFAWKVPVPPLSHQEG